MLRHRLGRNKQDTTPNLEMTQPSPSEAPASQPEPESRSLIRSPWMLYAIASGACAALNGVFAKLTTTTLTSSISSSIAHLLRLTSYENVVEILIRGIFFALNLSFNGIMWTLFTKALAKGSSTTQVSILNTSTNFMLTALLGLVIFAEALPPMWWVGASLLVVGNVIAGRKEDGREARAPAEENEVVPLIRHGDEGTRGEGSEDDVADLGDLSAVEDGSEGAK
ncbi:hypothetical protein E4U21_005705 [Claviceps maximensis]|nr:hypothetical protein E4U21_005705 [Claviceps maximensis]